MQCILAMCDIQIVGGLCILIAGFVFLFGEASVTVDIVLPELYNKGKEINITLLFSAVNNIHDDWEPGLCKKSQSGVAWRSDEPSPCRIKGPISAGDWQKIVYLAWFSNLTNQVALVFLRDHLRRNPRDRTLRLVFMFPLLVMLLVAMFPTSHFDWASVNPTGVSFPTSPAFCFFTTVTNQLYHPQWRIDLSWHHSWAFQSMLFSFLLITLSSIWRVIKIFDSTSAPFESKAAALRLWLEKQTISWLNKSPPGWISDLLL